MPSDNEKRRVLSVPDELSSICDPSEDETDHRRLLTVPDELSSIFDSSEDEDEEMSEIDAIPVASSTPANKNGRNLWPREPLPASEPNSLFQTTDEDLRVTDVPGLEYVPLPDDSSSESSTTSPDNQTQIETEDSELRNSESTIRETSQSAQSPCTTEAKDFDSAPVDPESTIRSELPDDPNTSDDMDIEPANTAPVDLGSTNQPAPPPDPDTTDSMELEEITEPVKIINENITQNPACVAYWFPQDLAFTSHATRLLVEKDRIDWKKVADSRTTPGEVIVQKRKNLFFDIIGNR